MRRDMSKRFIKHGKSGSKSGFPRNCKRLARKDEDGQFLECPHGMRKAHHFSHNWYWRDGEIGTDLAVLRRFLQSRVGRPWDEVYSEVCAEADDRSFDGHHLREWLEMEVEQNCYIEDGEVFDQRGLHMGNFWGEFYVHPETRTLEYVKKTRSYRAPVYEQKVFEMDDHLYHEHEGIWYRVKMQEVERKGDKKWGVYWLENVHDVFLSDYLTFAVYYYSVTEKLKRKYGLSPNGKVWVCVAKESANSREIAKLKKKHRLAA